MASAWFGLLGVLIGGLIAGVSTFALATRQELGDGVVAARLVNEDLIKRRTALADGPHQGSPAARNDELWNAHRIALARVLSLREWEALAECYRTPIEVDESHLDRAIELLGPWIRNKRSASWKRRKDMFGN